MEKKRDKANENIKILVNAPVDARKAALKDGNEKSCLSIESSEQFAMACSDYKKKYFERMREEMS